MSMKNSNDTIGNQTRDLLTCSAVPQPTAPPRSQVQMLNYCVNSELIPASVCHDQSVIVRDVNTLFKEFHLSHLHESIFFNGNEPPGSIHVMVFVFKMMVFSIMRPCSPGLANHWHSAFTAVPFFLFILPDQRLFIVKNMWIYHIPDCIEMVYELPSLPNNTASETYLHKSETVRSVDWMFITGTAVWRWLGE